MPDLPFAAGSAVEVDRLSHRYGTVAALDSVSFGIRQRSLFGVLGPNGCGKTTLFRVLSTLAALQEGAVRILGIDPARRPDLVRQVIGVTFQSPSLDRKLTVRENLACHGALHGLAGGSLRRRIDELLVRLGIADRHRDRVESLSGGLARRVEIAKGLIHDPQVLLLDEPSTGLDPGARIDLWRLLRSLRDASGTTVISTTHLMDEAEGCDELVLLDRGTVVAAGTPNDLRSSLGGDCLTIRSEDPAGLAIDIARTLHVAPRVAGAELRFDAQRDSTLLVKLLETFGPRVQSVSLAKPTLDDVFIERTGRRFWNAQ